MFQVADRYQLTGFQCLFGCAMKDFGQDLAPAPPGGAGDIATDLHSRRSGAITG